ncbi:MAG: AI-2E family transporter [Chromatiaceae bacterium]|nr:AI-2E family transporter [Chromatiaceae bacterium]
MGNAFAGFGAPARGLVVAAAIAILVAATRLAAPILAPMLLAIFIAIILTPLLRWMGRYRVPKWISLPLILFLLMDLGSILLLMTTGALEGLRDNLPGYQERFLLLGSQMGAWLEEMGIEGSSAALPDIFDPAEAMRGVRFLLSNVGNLAATGVLVLMAVIFLLMETATLPEKLKMAFDITPGGEARLRGLLSSINRYMIIKSLTSLTTAILVGLWLWLLGLDFIVVWVVLAFLLNFVPFVGSVLMAIPTLLFALVNHDIGTVLWVAIAYLAVNILIGNILEPRIMGRGLGISTFVVFVSLLFWGWVLGTIGVFLSVPLTMALMTALEASPQTRPIAILMGPPVQATAEAAAA